MTNGRAEREQKAFAKIEAKLKNLPPVITEWYYSMRAEEKSNYTISTYIDAVGKYIKMYNDNTNNFYKNITGTNVTKLMMSLRTKVQNGKIVPMSVGPRVQTWYGLNSFCTFLEENGYIEHNPIPPKSKPKQNDKPDIVALTAEEVNQYINNIRRRSELKFRNRDICIFVLGITTGLRSSAIIQINLEDVDLENRRIRVTEKRNKTFDVMVNDQLYHCLLNWMVDRRKYFANVDTDALFVSHYGQRLTYAGLHDMIIRYSAGMEKKVTPHVMRHTCATLLYEATGDIYLTATQLNHSNVSTTQRYADMSDKKRKDASEILGNQIKIK